MNGMDTIWTKIYKTWKFKVFLCDKFIHLLKYCLIAHLVHLLSSLPFYAQESHCWPTAHIFSLQPFHLLHDQKKVIYSMWSSTSLWVADQYLSIRSICFFTCAVLVSSKCKENGSVDLRRSLTIILVKYGDRPTEMIYDELVWLRLKLAAILLSGHTDLNNSPSLSVDLKLKLLEATFASQRISCFLTFITRETYSKAFGSRLQSNF